MNFIVPSEKKISTLNTNLNVLPSHSGNTASINSVPSNNNSASSIPLEIIPKNYTTTSDLAINLDETIVNVSPEDVPKVLNTEFNIYTSPDIGSNDYCIKSIEINLDKKNLKDESSLNDLNDVTENVLNSLSYSKSSISLSNIKNHFDFNPPINTKHRSISFSKWQEERRNNPLIEVQHQKIDRIVRLETQFKQQKNQLTHNDLILNQPDLAKKLNFNDNSEEINCVLLPKLTDPIKHLNLKHNFKNSEFNITNEELKLEFVSPAQWTHLPKTLNTGKKHNFTPLETLKKNDHSDIAYVRPKLDSNPIKLSNQSYINVKNLESDTTHTLTKVIQEKTQTLILVEETEFSQSENSSSSPLVEEAANLTNQFIEDHLDTTNFSNPLIPAEVTFNSNNSFGPGQNANNLPLQIIRQGSKRYDVVPDNYADDCLPTEPANLFEKVETGITHIKMTVEALVNSDNVEILIIADEFLKAVI